MRDTTQLHPELQAKIMQLKELCECSSLKIGISECVRTKEEQDKLYAQGRTAPGSIVTNAKGSSYSSMHQWGVAFDFYRNDGKGAYNDSDNFFAKVGAIGKKLGLEWGGDWTSIKDRPHFQLKDWGSTTSKLKSQYGTPEKFFSSWLIRVGNSITCTVETYVRETPGGEKSKYDSLTDTLKKKCERKSNGTAVFKVGQKITVNGIAVTEAGAVYIQTKAGKWICAYSSDGKGYHFK